MKKKHLSPALVFGLVLFTSSCVTTKTYTNEEIKMRLPESNVFVIKTNGEKIAGTKLSFIPKKKVTSIDVDGQTTLIADVAYYQSKSGYYAKFGTANNWNWVTQLKRGKINLYYYDVHFHGDPNKSVESHFVFQKGNEKMIEANITEIANMLIDNKAAYNEFTSQFGKTDKKVLPKQLQNHPKVLFSAIDIYNAN
jgi:hypothetical protein